MELADKARRRGFRDRIHSVAAAAASAPSAPRWGILINYAGGVFLRLRPPGSYTHHPLVTTAISPWFLSFWFFSFLSLSLALSLLLPLSHLLCFLSLSSCFFLSFSPFSLNVRAPVLWVLLASEVANKGAASSFQVREGTPRSSSLPAQVIASQAERAPYQRYLTASKHGTDTTVTTPAPRENKPINRNAQIHAFSTLPASESAFEPLENDLNFHCF